MLRNSMKLDDNVNKKANEIDFSGVVLVKDESGESFHSASGYANRVEELSNNLHTRFGIASGCKLFTAIAICQLVEQGKLSYSSQLKDCLDVDFPQFDEGITIHHLLTHSSGIPDYFDEEVMDDFEELWKERPMYLLNNLKNFLPMFQERRMMFKPGEKFQYNNAGFIVLGLIVEQQSGLSFTEYVEQNIFEPAGMKESGYFSMDKLPRNTAYGYIDDNEAGTWRTNVYSLPIKGGADGGAFVTAPDMIKLWENLLNCNLLNKENTEALLKPHIEEDGDEYYGYGVWISKRNDTVFKYHVMGYDPGVSFHSSYYPETGVKLVVASNKSKGAFAITRAVEETLNL